MRVVSLFVFIPFWRALCIAKLTGRTTRASRYLARNTARSKFSLRLCGVMRGWCLRSPDFFGGLLKTSLPDDPFHTPIDITGILLMLYVLWAQHVMRTGWESIHGISGCPHIPKGPDDLNSRTEMAWAKKIFLSKHIEKNKFKLSIETCNFIQLVMSEVHRRLRFDETHGNIPKGRDGKIARLLGMLLGHMKERHDLSITIA